MFRSPRIFALILILMVSLAWSGCTTNRACKLGVNKKKLAYYNSLQYRGARKK